ncbi:TonB-dependent receptor plug domain-containing protein [Phenylobacterium sp. J367]|uniref:TonB-dependent receptor plug domain-containing protein n=1 Tax=Phenylobacterium sp. J367 TaxID=2898435 RepID=UPI0035B21174
MGTVVDGVYRARSGVAFGDLGELERIEVLKGPQGTVFGKNTSAGVINVITKAPEFDFSAQGEVTAANYDGFGIAGSVTGPISETVAARLYAARRVRDGFYHVRNGAGPSSQKDNDDQDVWTVRGQALWLPTDTLSLKFLADYTKREEQCCLNVTTLVGPTGAIIDALAADEGTPAPRRPGPPHRLRQPRIQPGHRGLRRLAAGRLGDQRRHHPDVDHRLARLDQLPGQRHRLLVGRHLVPPRRRPDLRQVRDLLPGGPAGRASPARSTGWWAATIRTNSSRPAPSRRTGPPMRPISACCCPPAPTRPPSRR